MKNGKDVMNEMINTFGLAVDTDKKLMEKIIKAGEANRQGDWSIELPVVNIKVPPGVLIKCPMVSSAFIQALECPDCPHFRGIMQSAWNDEQPLSWPEKYFINCGKPMTRKTVGIMTTVKNKS